jgi:hypothetical protein
VSGEEPHILLGANGVQFGAGEERVDGRFRGTNRPENPQIAAAL